MLERMIRVFAKDDSEVEQLMAPFRGSSNVAVQRAISSGLKHIYDAPPRIAVIGKTGVGKSSSINALFSPKKQIRIGHVVATTRKPKILDLVVATKGKVSIIDLPGLGESIEADDKYIPMYQEILPTCDVILWVIKADDRVLAGDQRYIRDVLTDKCKNKLVIGINQVDVMKPGKWIDAYNVPSKQQEASISRKVKDVKQKLKSVGVDEKHIIAYSATKHYHLADLFTAMIEACPDEREWVLSARMNLAPYTAPVVGNQTTPP